MVGGYLHFFGKRYPQMKFFSTFHAVNQGGVIKVPNQVPEKSLKEGGGLFWGVFFLTTEGCTKKLTSSSGSFVRCNIFCRIL